MPYCRECGAKIPEDMLFCDSCGSETSEQWYCEACGRQISETQNRRAKGYCGICKPKTKETPTQGFVGSFFGGVISITYSIGMLSLVFLGLFAPPEYWFSTSNLTLALSGIFLLAIGIFLLFISYLKLVGRIILRGRGMSVILGGLVIFFIGIGLFLLGGFRLINPYNSGLIVGILGFTGIFVIAVGLVILLRSNYSLLVKR